MRLGPFVQERDRANARFEREYVERLLIAADGNVTRAAQIAEVKRSTIYRLMDRHGVVITRTKGTFKIEITKPKRPPYPTEGNLATDWPDDIDGDLDGYDGP